MALVISFCSGVERVDERVYCYAFIFPSLRLHHHYESMQANGVMHGEKSIGVRSGGMIVMVLLSYIYLFLVSYKNE